MARNAHDSAQRTGCQHRPDDVDVHRRAADEPSELQHEHPLRTSLARDHPSRNCRARAVGHAAYADQHAGQLLIASRLQRHVRQPRNCERHAYRGNVSRSGLPSEFRRERRADQERKLAGAPRGSAGAFVACACARRRTRLAAHAGAPSGFGLDADCAQASGSASPAESWPASGGHHGRRQCSSDAVPPHGVRARRLDRRLFEVCTRQVARCSASVPSRSFSSRACTRGFVP